MSTVGLSRFLSLFFSFVKVDNPASYKYMLHIVVKGVKSKIYFPYPNGKNDDRDGDQFLVFNYVSLVR